METKNRRFFRLFFVIMAFTALSLAYLFVAQIGLVIDGKINLESGELEVFMKNDSSHVIYDINVFYVDDQENKHYIGSTIAKLDPSEMVLIDVQKGYASKGSIRLRAVAPYHLMAAKDITVQELGIVDLDGNVSGPNRAFTNSALPLTLQVCNHGKKVDNVEITPLYNSAFFDVQSQTVMRMELDQGECRLATFEFLPKRAGSTAILFNIAAESFNQRVQKNVEIVEGGP